jgi:hypothetical protein
VEEVVEQDGEQEVEEQEVLEHLFQVEQKYLQVVQFQ